MIVNIARLQSSAMELPMQVSHPKHIAQFADGAPVMAGDIKGNQPTFQDVMLKAMDGVSSDQRVANKLAVKAVTDPGSVDVHDITIAQAKASMSLNITRTVLNRVVQGWKDIVNTR